MRASTKDKNNIQVIFRADEATIKAINELAAAYTPEPGDLSASKSRVIRDALIKAAAQLKKK